MFDLSLKEGTKPFKLSDVHEARFSTRVGGAIEKQKDECNLIVYIVTYSPETRYVDNNRLQCIEGAIRSLKDIYHLCKYYYNTTEQRFHELLKMLVKEQMIEIHYCSQIKKFTLWEGSCHYAEEPSFDYDGFPMIDGLVDLDTEPDINYHKINTKAPSRVKAAAEMRSFRNFFNQ